MLLMWGRPVEARRELEIARTLNPSKVQVHRMLALSYYVERDFPNAIAIFRAAISWQPQDFPSHRYLGLAHRATDQYEKAIDILEAAENIESGRTPLVAARFDRLRQAFLQRGKQGYWEEEWNQAPTNEFYKRATILARLGKADDAFKWLNQAYQAHERYGPIQDALTRVIYDEVWDPFRHDPRFQDLLEKIGFTKVNPKLKE